MPEKLLKTLRAYFLPLALLALVYFPLFHNLDRLPMAQFDEARVAMSSYEMSENYNFLVVHYDGKPDMWSTKPPLTNWAQVFFIKVLGLSPLSVRLPSAIAGLLTCILLWAFCVYYLKNHWMGAISVLVLATSQGFINQHVTRTADYDAMLVLFTTASALAYYVFIDTLNFKYLKWFFICLALAVLTKSVAGLFLLPGLFVFTLTRYKSMGFFKEKKTYIYLLYFIVPVLIIYLGREALNPGYLKAAWHWDVAGRFSEQLTGAEPYFGYYIHLLKTEHFVHWFFIAGAGILLGLFSIDERIRKVTVFASCSALCFIVIISSAKTQMLWYEAPVYPLAALLVAAAVYWLIDVLQSLIKNLVFNFIPYLLIIKLIFIPYKEILNSVNPPRFKANWEPEAQALNLYLMDAYKSGRNLDGYNWVDDDWYNPYIYFHVKMFEENRGQVIQQKHLDSLNARETVIGFLNTVKPEIEKRYQFDVLEEKEFVKVYRIKGRKRR